MAYTRICSIEGCGKPRRKRGYCETHYTRAKRHGSPDTVLAHKAERGEPLRFFKEEVLNYTGDECLIWPYGKAGTGYGVLFSGGKNRTVSRMVCSHIHGPDKTGRLHAAHSCGKGHLGCVSPSHLSWKTSAENVADMIGHGTARLGQSTGTAKLHEADVLEIRRLGGTLLQREIAARFGVSREAVGEILRGKTWAWLT